MASPAKKQPPLGSHPKSITIKTSIKKLHLQALYTCTPVVGEIVILVSLQRQVY
jgi:hypothetical protein